MPAQSVSLVNTLLMSSQTWKVSLSTLNRLLINFDKDDCHEKYFHIQSEGICDDGLNEIEEKIIQASSDENIVEICLLSRFFSLCLCLICF